MYFEILSATFEPSVVESRGYLRRQILSTYQTESIDELQSKRWPRDVYKVDNTILCLLRAGYRNPSAVLSTELPRQASATFLSKRMNAKPSTTKR